MEALIGALYLDAGLDAARAFVRRHGATAIDARRAAPQHPKSALQEWAAAHNRKPPDYDVVDRSRPAPRAALHGHASAIGKLGEATGEGTSKQEAETAAAAALAGDSVTDMTAQHCGLVAVVGAPNAGKSTLVNALVGQKVAIVSPKAQTTRARLMGIAIEGETQLLLVDTPGIFEPKRRLDRAMVAGRLGRGGGRRPDRAGGRRQGRDRPPRSTQIIESARRPARAASS